MTLVVEYAYNSSFRVRLWLYPNTRTSAHIHTHTGTHALTHARARTHTRTHKRTLACTLAHAHARIIHQIRWRAVSFRNLLVTSSLNCKIELLYISMRKYSLNCKIELLYISMWKFQVLILGFSWEIQQARCIHMGRHRATNRVRLNVSMLNF